MLGDVVQRVCVSDLDTLDKVACWVPLLQPVLVLGESVYCQSVR